jgi:nucleotide-binding universal stress UspA family protein
MAVERGVMRRIRHILVAVDRFPQSAEALARAIELGRAHRAKLTIVHIVNALEVQSPVTAPRHLLKEQALRLGRKHIDDAIRTIDLSGLNVEILVETGSAYSRIVEKSKKHGVDLIVLRAHQRRSILEKIIGSTADRIIRAAPSSVLVVKRPVLRTYLNVVVGVDFAKNSESAAVLAAELCPSARLQLVHVMHVSAQFEHTLRQAGTSQAEFAAFKSTLANYSDERLRNLAVKFVGHEPALRTRVIDGDPARSLVRLTRNRNVDLIEVVPYKLGVIHQALLGSVTQRLLRDASCDVLISRQPSTPSHRPSAVPKPAELPAPGTPGNTVLSCSLVYPLNE